jgi:hypothetical protein
MTDREYRPGVEVYVPKPSPKIACCWTAVVDGTHLRCTDSAMPGRFYCALHKPIPKPMKPKPWWG